MSDSAPAPSPATTRPDTPAAARPTADHQPQYGCPHCDATYAHEVFTRVHLTRADDETHRTDSGFESGAEVIVSTDGEVTEHRNYQPDTIDPSAITRDAFPADLSDKAVSALVVATRNPTLTDRRLLTEQVRESLAETSWEPPIERTVDQAVTTFYHPHLCGDDETPTFATLTTKQQAILLTRLALPDASSETIATYTDCSKNYPRKTCRNHAEVLESLRERYEAGEDLSAIITQELPTAARDDLLATGQVAPLLFDEANDDTSSQSSPSAGTATDDSEGASDTPETTTPAQTRLPSEPSAATHDGAADATLSPSSFATVASLRDEEPDGDKMTATAPAVTTTCADELEDLARQVQFVKEAVSVTDPDRETTLLINLFEQIETRCRHLSDELREA